MTIVQQWVKAYIPLTTLFCEPEKLTDGQATQLLGIRNLTEPMQCELDFATFGRQAESIMKLQSFYKDLELTGRCGTRAPDSVAGAARPGAC